MHSRFTPYPNFDDAIDGPIHRILSHSIKIPFHADKSGLMNKHIVKHIRILYLWLFCSLLELGGERDE
jgi:hypothetical protein